MNTKICKHCSKPIRGAKTSRQYHKACFKLYRQEYLKKYNKTVRTVRFNVDNLKEEIEALTKKIEELTLKVK